jgi:hypothetical protein
LCPNSFTVYSGRCYSTITGTLLTWADAQTYCVNNGGYLMIINNQAEYDLLLTFYAASGAGRVWVYVTYDFSRIINSSVYFFII